MNVDEYFIEVLLLRVNLTELESEIVYSANV